MGCLWILDNLPYRYRQARRKAAVAAAAPAVDAATAKQRAPLMGAETEIFKLVSAGATPEQWAEWLRVPLEHAAAAGNHDLFTKLVEAGANCGAGWAGCGGRTLLDAAALGGNEDITSTALKMGSRSDVNVLATSSKRSALYTAVVGGHEAAARKLILAGADANYVDPLDGYPALVPAVCSGSAILVNDLLLAGAHSGLLCRDRESGEVFSPLQIAAAAGRDEVVSTLLIANAPINLPDSRGSCTELMRASERGHLATVKVLLAAGADVSVREHFEYGDGKTALEIAIYCGHTDVVKAIVSHMRRCGADVDARDERGFAALHHASGQEEDRAAMIDVLLDAGADIAGKTSIGHTPLHLAVMRRCRVNALVLMQRGASVCEPDYSGDRPLHVAAREGSCQAVLALLQGGALLDETDKIGSTALHSAANSGMCETVLVLLQHGANLNATDEGGNTPLHLACNLPTLKLDATVDLLLRWGASELTVNNASQTPLQLLDETLDEVLTPGHWRRGIAERQGGTQVTSALARITRVVLELAPVDRAWRRRCLLVMLRARIEKERAPHLASPSEKEDMEDEENHRDRGLAQENLGVGCVKEGWAEEDTSGAFVRNDGTAGGGILEQDADGASVAAVDDTACGLVSVVVELMPNAVFQNIVLHL